MPPTRVRALARRATRAWTPASNWGAIMDAMRAVSNMTRYLTDCLIGS
jgi:hypothetical protein